MLVPRAFSYQSNNRSAASNDVAVGVEKRPQRQYTQPVVSRGFGWRPGSFHTADQPSSKPASTQRTRSESPAAGNTTPEHKPDAKTITPMTTEHSKPVAVPSRRRGGRPLPNNSLPDGSGPHGRVRDTSREGSRDRRNVSSSVAAVLASTSIPRRTSFPKKSLNSPSNRRISINELVEEWKQMDHVASSLSSSPAMEMLLSPPDELDEDPLLDADDDESIEVPRRTTSNNSIPSLDDSSTQSGLSFSMPSTPAMNGTSIRGRDRIVSSPRSINASADHPLQFDKEAVEYNEPSTAPTMALPLPALPARTPSPKASKPTSFRSNLTASLKSFSSNLTRTFSNFSAPNALLPQDHLTQSFLGSAPYHPEMRPRPLTAPPNSKLRRYMNPHAFQPYDFHLHNHAIHDADLEVVAAANSAAAEARAAGELDAPLPSADMLDAIPLEPFVVRSAKDRAAKETSTEAGRTRIGQGERREPRENPDFLRIAVLELEMRRAGKTEGPPVGFKAGAGRRGWWLSPREVNNEECAEFRRRGHVPARWVGISVDEAGW